MYLHLTLVAEFKDRGYAAHCPELGTASCGDTLEEAFANLRDAIDVHLNALREVGELQQYLQQHNVELFEQPQPTARRVTLNPNSCATTAVQLVVS